MPKGIILYQSKYGATKRYADWMVRETGFDCICTKDAKIQDVLQYDTVIFAGGIYASGIAGLSFLKKHFSKLQGKQIAVFFVGASPYTEEAFKEIYAHNFQNSLQGIPCFYARGAWNADAMSWKDRTLCKMLQKAVAKQDSSTYAPWQKALMDATEKGACDWTDQKYLEPLLGWVKGENTP